MSTNPSSTKRIVESSHSRSTSSSRSAAFRTVPVQQQQDNNNGDATRTSDIVEDNPAGECPTSHPAQHDTVGGINIESEEEGDVDPEDSRSAKTQGSDLEEDAEYELVDTALLAQPERRNQTASPTQERRRGSKRTFILRRARPQKYPQMEQLLKGDYADHYDYEKKYTAPLYPWGEMEPDARVWRVYLDEAGAYDGDMVENYKDTVDVILVFAGLFSAVVTTLAVEAAHSVQPDYGQVVASILLQQLIAQRAATRGEAAPDSFPSALSLDTFTSSPSPSDLWVSGLWFTSLAFSLSTALIGVLVKQWIQAYAAPVSGPPRAQARLRQYRFTGLDKWHVPLIIGLLPTLLHLSLLLFLVGLVVYLFNLDHISATVVASITLFSYTTYSVTNLLPLFDSQCPYKTPLSTYSYALFHPYIPAIKSSLRSAAGIVSLFKNYLATCIGPSIALLRKLLLFTRHNHPHEVSTTPLSGYKSPSKLATEAVTLKNCELADIQNEADAVDARSLAWLATTSSNPSVSTIVVRAVAGLPAVYRAKDILREEGMIAIICAQLRSFFDNHGQWRSGIVPERYSSARTAHRRLGIGLDETGTPVLACPDDGAIPWNRNCNNLCLHETHLFTDPGVQVLGSLDYFPSPEECLGSHHSAGWAHNTSQATLYHRATMDHERFSLDRWPTCYKLLQLTHVAFAEHDLHDDLQALEQVMIPMFLSAQVTPPFPGEPQIINSLLFNELPFELSEKVTELRIVSFGFHATFISGILGIFQASHDIVEARWWWELCTGLKVLADAAQEHRGLFEAVPDDFTGWLSASIRALLESLELFIASPSVQSLEQEMQISFAISIIRLNPPNKSLPQLSSVLYPDLMRLVLQAMEPLSSTSPSASSDALCQLLDFSSESEHAKKYFRSQDVLSSFQHFFSQREDWGPFVAKCADKYLHLIARQNCGDDLREEEDEVDYALKHLHEICPWYMSSEWGLDSGLFAFLRGRPSSGCWEEGISQLKARQLAPVLDGEEQYGPILIRQLETELTKARAEEQQEDRPLLSAATFASVTAQRSFKVLGRQFTSAIQKLRFSRTSSTSRGTQDTNTSVENTQPPEKPENDLDTRQPRDLEEGPTPPTEPELPRNSVG